VSTVSDSRDALPPPSTTDALYGPRAELAKVIPRRPRVSWWLGVLLAIGFAIVLLPMVTADRWLGVLPSIAKGAPAAFTVRVPPFAGVDTAGGHIGSGGVLIRRGEVASTDAAVTAAEIDASVPHGPVPYIAFVVLLGVLAALFTHHTRRSVQGRLLRVQLVSLAVLVVIALVVKALMLTTSFSVLVIPVALFAMVPTLVLDRVVGLATGTLAALVVALLVPFDVGVAVMLLVQAGAAGLVIAERPKRMLRPVLVAGAAATLFTAATYPLMLYLTAGRLPLDELRDPLHSAWFASALGPALATVLAIPLAPLYQLCVGEITHSKLVELEDLSHPLLKQIASKSPGTWQHSLMMANMAEIAANAIGANGRLVRVGAYFHDLGKSLQPKYFIENLEPGETSPHDKLPPEVSCDAIFAHVTEGIVTARRAGLHERIIDFMHMHHGNGVLEYFWGKTKEQGNPKALSVEHFRYPGVPPQSRETAILSICDAVEAASRTLKKPDVQSIDNLVQRIVYGKLHLGQLDESGLSMGDLRRIAESLRETIRHANHGRIEYPWQKAQQDASAPPNQEKLTQTGPRLDSLDRPAHPDTVAAAARERDVRDSADALAKTDDAGVTPRMKPAAHDSSELATKTTAPVTRPATSTAERAAQAQTWSASATSAGMNLSAEIPLRLSSRDVDGGTEDPATTKYPKENIEDVVELRTSKPAAPSDFPADPSTSGSGDYANMSVKDMTNPGSLGTFGAPVAPEKSAVAELAESDARMRRVTNPVMESQRASKEVLQFATDANRALQDASKEQRALPADAVAASAASSKDIQIMSQQIIAEASADGPTTLPPPSTTDVPAARKRAATLPPLKPPSVPPPIGRRSPTTPPALGMRPTSSSSPPNLTVPPPADLRPPAPAQVVLPGLTNPPPLTVRPPGINYLDDMITLRPQYEVRPDVKDLAVRTEEDGSIRIEPAKSEAASEPQSVDDALVTQPRMLVDPGDTSPNLDLPLRAPPSSPVIPVPGGGAPLEGEAATSWARGLEARLAAQLDAADAAADAAAGAAAASESDDDYAFGRKTPASPPTRAELQALLNSPPDVTRQQSYEEIEKLHRQTQHLREAQSQELDFTRRVPYPTSEVDEADIEAAIELAPPARRNVVGVAKKPKKE
jgi:cyclic-di-AMP phosphodiesterase PgpH